LATSFSLFVFDQFSPLVDAKLYQNEFYSNTGHIRVYIIQFLAKFTNFITTPLMSHYIFSIISVLGMLWLVLSRKVTWFILLILFLPSSMIWTSIIGKESIFYLCFSIILIIWSDYIKNKFTFNHFLILSLTACICLLLRPHYTVCLPWLFWVAIILKRTSKFKIILLISYLFLTLILLFIVFFGDQIDLLIKMNLFDLKWRAFTTIDIDARASRHFDLGLGKYIKYFEDVSTYRQVYWHEIGLLQHFNKLFGLGFIFGVVGPLPNELAERPEFIPFFIEGVIILFLPFIILFFLFIKKSYNYGDINYLNYIYGVLPAIILVMIVHAFFGILNPGTAIRWRVNFELLFYFAPLLLYFNTLESKNNKNIQINLL
jgi:hypothetical protein